MKSLNTKLALAAVGFALLATPAFAQRPHHQTTHQQVEGSITAAPAVVGTYPNGALRTGSAESVESGQEFNLLR